VVPADPDAPLLPVVEIELVPDAVLDEDAPLGEPGDPPAADDNCAKPTEGGFDLKTE